MSFIEVEPQLEPVAEKPTSYELPTQTTTVQLPEEWFWEIDRYGNINYLSENSEGVLTSPSASMVGEDFLCLWTSENDTDDSNDSFIALYVIRESWVFKSL